MQVTLNVHMDATLKKRGDKVLRDHGLSATEAVRALWQELADTRTVPKFMKIENGQNLLTQRKVRAVEDLVGIASQEARKMSDRQLKDARYTEMLRTYEALSTEL